MKSLLHIINGQRKMAKRRNSVLLADNSAQPGLRSNQPTRRDYDKVVEALNQQRMKTQRLLEQINRITNLQNQNYSTNYQQSNGEGDPGTSSDEEAEENRQTESEVNDGDTHQEIAPFTNLSNTQVESNKTKDGISNSNKDNSTTPSFVTDPTKGGLYGESSMPSQLKEFPKLTGNTGPYYVKWIQDCKLHFTSASLTDIITTSPTQSFNTAVTMDPLKRDPVIIMSQWAFLHRKCYTELLKAIKDILGNELELIIETEQQQIGAFEFKFSNREGGNGYEILDVGNFKRFNSNHLWCQIKSKATYTQVEKNNLLFSVNRLRYDGKTDPQLFRNRFMKLKQVCILAGIPLTDEHQISIWTNAIPPSLGSIEQILMSDDKPLTVDRIYTVLNNWYISQRSKPTRGGSEMAALAQSSAESCTYCNKPGHTAEKCYKNKNSKNYKHQFKRSKPTRQFNRFGSKSTGTSTAPTKNKAEDGKSYEFSCAAVEGDQSVEDIINELEATCISNSEVIMTAKEKKQKETPPTFFVFDSAATSHMTPRRQHLIQLEDCAPVGLTTAVKGTTTLIRQRGTVRLNADWILKDVAYVPTGSASLISEGRLCDAGFGVDKTKDQVRVYDIKTNKTLLKGFRHNRLWMFATNNFKPEKNLINTLQKKKTQDYEEQMDESDESDTEVDSPQTNNKHTNPYVEEKTHSPELDSQDTQQNSSMRSNANILTSEHDTDIDLSTSGRVYNNKNVTTTRGSGNNRNRRIPQNPNYKNPVIKRVSFKRTNEHSNQQA